MTHIYISMPGGSEWLIILLIPIFIFALGYYVGRKSGLASAYKKMLEQKKE